MTSGLFEWTMLATPSPIIAHLSPTGPDTVLQLQHEAPSAKDACDSLDDDSLNGEAEEIPPEGDFMVIVELDHVTVVLGDDADKEDDNGFTKS